MTDLLKSAVWVLLGCALWESASALPPSLLRTPGYQAPVRGGPGDLLLIAGSGFQLTDRVVYRAYDVGNRPDRVPAGNSAAEGEAAIVKLGDPPYALTVRLPESLELNRPYRFWVVNEEGEWSEPVSINDLRPRWFTPAYLFSTADLAGLGRTLRIVGRNLRPAVGKSMQIRLQGGQTYLITAPAPTREGPVDDYVAEGPLPKRLEPGAYSIAITRDGRTWVPVPAGPLEVRPDPVPAPTFDISEAKYGGCHPDDGVDDTACLREALAAARRAGAGTIYLPEGSWDVFVHQLLGDEQQNGFVLPRNISLRGAGSKLTRVIRHDATASRAPGALLTLTGASSLTGVSFTDETRYTSLQQSRAMIQLGIRSGPAAAQTPQVVDDIVISSNAFYRVGRAIADSSRPIDHLFVTHNEFGGYDNSLLLTGSGASGALPYRIDNSVIRWNRFVPGSYLDIAARQGTVATQLGASNHLDFSSNVADGTSAQGLQQPDDPPGWRAAFFWNLNNNQEETLIAQNVVSCSGDKAGDGEAIALDGNGATFAFDRVPLVMAAGADWVQVRGPSRRRQFGQSVTADYYRGHWMVIVEGVGLGQARKVESYSENPADGTVLFHVSPKWDVIPHNARVAVGRQYWQVYVVGNEVSQAQPLCHKSNLTDARGGLIGFWAPIADSTIEGNHQLESDGIELGQGYDALTPSISFLTAIEVRGNLIDGEYDWESDCSWSGIRPYFIALGGPEARPPIVSFGLQISHNILRRADGQRGGAIDFAHSGPSGPPPGTWPLVENPLIFGNQISDLEGSLPRAQCRQKQQLRAGIRLEGPDNIHDAVLAGNRCERVATHLEDKAVGTLRLCASRDPDSCECSDP